MGFLLLMGRTNESWHWWAHGGMLISLPQCRMIDDVARYRPKPVPSTGCRLRDGSLCRNGSFFCPAYSARSLRITHILCCSLQFYTIVTFCGLQRVGVHGRAAAHHMRYAQGVTVAVPWRRMLACSILPHPLLLSFFFSARLGLRGCGLRYPRKAPLTTAEYAYSSSLTGV